MAKTNQKMHLHLIITGYALFSLLLISVFLSTTLPWISILSNPHSIKINAVIAMISLMTGALLPALVAYFIGDHSIRSRSKLRHHFNGMLFGLLAYWLMILTTVFLVIPHQIFPDNNARLILTNLVPSLAVAILTTAIAIMHLRSKQAKLDVIEYKPFVIVLVASILAMPILSIVDNILTNSISIYTFITPSIVLVSGVVAYTTLSKVKLSKIQKIAWSAVSVSMLFATIFVANLFESAIVGYLRRPTMEVQEMSAWIGFSLALIGWAIYWLYQLKTLRNS